MGLCMENWYLHIIIINRKMTNILAYCYILYLNAIQSTHILGAFQKLCFKTYYRITCNNVYWI